MNLPRYKQMSPLTDEPRHFHIISFRVSPSRHISSAWRSAWSNSPRVKRKSKLTKEIPRLCRGGSKRLTFPAVAPQAPIDETASVSRQAHEHRFIDGRVWERLSQRAESAKCYAALIPRIG